MTTTAPSGTDAASRTILRTDWVPCKTAFIDTRTPGSDQKDNYSFIGPGVSQNSDQFVNIAEPHGFNMGAAGMPHGLVNSLHLHFTAEVFINFDGDYLLRWGAEGEQGTYRSLDGDIISVPPWVFRGFTNEGSGDGVLLTVLGQDRTGGIIWGPKVIEEAGKHGLYLSSDNQLVDTTQGDSLEGVELIEPMPQAEIDRLDVVTEEQFATRVTRPQDRVWQERPFLCSVLPGGRAELSLIIGYGLTEQVRDVPRLHDPHSFTVAWLRAAQGEGMLEHTIDRHQVLVARTGSWEVAFETEEGLQTVELNRLDAVSIPPGARRSLKALAAGEDGTSEILVVVEGDGRAHQRWSDEVVAAAQDAGWVLDPNGYVAPSALLANSPTPR
ncbi:hypothetical protein [Brachybacterium sp.]|uniref:hypothetical protein n=1 Tax=Brachybacterium sp. TaxID=1891286 RepID=UPI002ECFFEA6